MKEAFETIDQLRKKATTELASARSPAELEEWRIVYLGRKGALPLLLRRVKDLPLTDRKIIGASANQLRQELKRAYSTKYQKVVSGRTAGSRAQPAVELKHKEALRGHLHPITLTIRRIQDVFSAMGYLLAEGPEVEESRYDFDLLNIPLEHPSRAETDTFYVADPQGGSNNRLVLRTSTSPVQLRAVLENDLIPPLKVFSPGRVFRNEKPDPSHESVFHQTEGLSVGQNVTIADFKGTIEMFYLTFFGKEVKTRLRPGYFPFVEPGFEFDVECFFCGGDGCRVCKDTGWLEMGGAGMVHPVVLRNMNIDSRKYQGFAFGFGIERLAMLRHGINDIRLFWSGDIRFLTQFS